MQISWGDGKRVSQRAPVVANGPCGASAEVVRGDPNHPVRYACAPIEERWPTLVVHTECVDKDGKTKWTDTSHTKL